MGGGTFDPHAYRAFSNATVGKATGEIYTSRKIEKSLDPLGVKIRESRDSIDNPNSTPLIVALDVTGSMGMLADNIAREGLGTLFTGILERKPISDPHIMFMGIGDANFDKAPLQISQFEADKRIIEQLTLLYLEHGGGGNQFESYDLAWYFAARHTVHDAMEMRGRRGYLFTVGDEEAPHGLSANQIETICGDKLQTAIDPKEILREVERTYNVFHVVIKEGNHARAFLDGVVRSWSPLLGQHLILLDDHKKLAETIVSAIEVAEGADAEASAKAWGHDSGAIVHDAIKNLPRGASARPMIGHVS